MKRIYQLLTLALLAVSLMVTSVPVHAEGKADPEKNNSIEKNTKESDSVNRKFTAYHFISVGSSDAILIESCGRFGLIDASNPSQSKHPQYNFGSYNGNKVVDYLIRAGVTHLDFVLATHSHSDHIGGMPTVARSGLVDSNTVYFYKHYAYRSDTREQIWYDEDYYIDGVNAMRIAGADLIDVNEPDTSALQRAKAIKSNDRIRFAMGDLNLTLYNLDIKQTGGENENTICLLAQDQTNMTRTLFLGDLEPRQGSEKQVTDEVYADGGTVNAIKVAHHGYDNTTTEYMLNKLSPQYLFVENDFFSPAPWFALWAYPNHKETYWSGQDPEGIVAFPSANRYHVTTSEYFFNMIGSGSSDIAALPAIDQAYLNWAVEPGKNRLANRWYKWIEDVESTPLQGGDKDNFGYYEACHYYYTDENGNYVKNEFRWINGKWYYFDAQGHMLTGWQNINGYSYYFEDSGAMSASQYVDGYWLNADGTWTYPYRASWRLNSVGWWYGDDSGWYARNQWETINGIDYYFDNNGYMVSNRYIQGYWLGADGGLRYPYQASWQINPRGWRYGDTAGWYARNQWESIDGVYYYFDDDGYMVANKYVQGYWLGADGAWRYPYRASWRLNSRGWWYGDATGWYARNQWESIDGTYYFFDRNGYLLANQYIGGYWLGASGAWTYPDIASWHLDSNGWWYGDNTGWYARNEQLRIDGTTYQFDAQGYML